MMNREPNRMSTQDDFLGDRSKNRDTVIFGRYRVNPDLIYPPLDNLKDSDGDTVIYRRFYPYPNISSNASPANNDRTVSLNGISMTATQGALSPGTGSMQLTPEPIRIKVSDSVTVTTSPAVSDGRFEEGLNSANLSHDLLERLSLAIPEELREEIFGDLLELRAKRRNAGDSLWQIRWITVSQL
jgi:hypothetical protein